MYSNKLKVTSFMVCSSKQMQYILVKNKVLLYSINHIVLLHISLTLYSPEKFLFDFYNH